MVEFLLYFFAAVGVLTSVSWVFLFVIIREELKALNDINPVIDLDDLN